MEWTLLALMRWDYIILGFMLILSFQPAISPPIRPAELPLDKCVTIASATSTLLDVEEASTDDDDYEVVVDGEFGFEPVGCSLVVHTH